MRSYFRILLAAKAQREGRSISLREVGRATNVPMSTLMGMANNTMRRVSVDELNALCDYLGCEVGDILKREDVPDA